MKSLVQNGLADYVAMDIKNSKRQYCKTAGIEESRELMERIQESVAFLLGHPVAYEFRTTVIIRGNRLEKLDGGYEGLKNIFCSFLWTQES